MFKKKKIEYEAIINDYYANDKSLRFLNNYIGELYFDKRINMNRWFELHCFILNLGDY